MNKYVFFALPLFFFIASLAVPGSERPLGDDSPKTDRLILGCAVVPELLRSDSLYKETVLREFSSLTAENVMKMKYIWKSRYEYDWTESDYLVEFAEEHGLRLHGHALIWYSSVPDWLKEFEKEHARDTVLWKVLMKEYIHAVAGRYRGRIASWDVVNEAVEKDGKISADGSFFRGDEDIWYRNIGPEYIDLAFHYAREADPTVLLFYNDYGMEWATSKRDRICELVNGMKARGVPVDGIGIQMHTSTNRSFKDINDAIAAACACGVKVHVSELDVTLNPDKLKGFVPDSLHFEKQKTIYSYVAEAMKNIPSEFRFGITTWGVADNRTWLPNGFPLMFDKNYARKPAYEGILEVFGRKEM